MAEIDQSYIQFPDHLPKPAMVDAHVGEIPIIDLSRKNEDLITQVGHACEAWGVFLVVNHGIPIELERKVQSCTKKFFDLSVDEKRKVARDEVNPLGYHDSEHTGNVKDWKEIYDFLIKDSAEFFVSPEPQDLELTKFTNRLPQYPPKFKETMEEYGHEMERVSYKLLELIAMSLGLPANRFLGYFGEKQLSTLRLNYYPPCPFSHVTLGVGSHIDPGALTLLAQDDVAGLEFKRKSDGEWIPVKPLPHALVVNVDDVMQVWSNDKYEAVEHRAVVHSEKKRFSIPFFLFPSPHVVVKPLEELVNEQNPARYREYSWGKFYADRLFGDFKKREVENLQIHHFKILD